jgi:hypothetical protein
VLVAKLAVNQPNVPVPAGEMRTAIKTNAFGRRSNRVAQADAVSQY